MPNHVSNKISGPALGQIREFLGGKELVDFNRVIPQPEGLKVEPHTGVIDAAKFALKEFPNPNAEGMQGIEGL